MSILPQGKYLATVTGTALGLTGGGKEQVGVSLDVHLADGSGSVPRTWYGFFTEKAITTTIKALGVLGFDLRQRDITELNCDPPNSTPILGAKCEVTIEHEVDAGANGEIRFDENGNERMRDRIRDRIRWINAPGGSGLGAMKRMDTPQAASFGARIRAQARSLGGPPAASANRPAQGAARPNAPQRPAAPAAPAKQHDPPLSQSAPLDDIPF